MDYPSLGMGAFSGWMNQGWFELFEKIKNFKHVPKSKNSRFPFWKQMTSRTNWFVDTSRVEEANGNVCGPLWWREWARIAHNELFKTPASPTYGLAYDRICNACAIPRGEYIIQCDLILSWKSLVVHAHLLMIFCNFSYSCAEVAIPTAQLVR